jgi:hypothetical protein
MEFSRYEVLAFRVLVAAALVVAVLDVVYWRP